MSLKDESKAAGPITLASGWTVEVDQNACIGAAPCTAIAPNTFGLDANGKAVILSTVDQDDNETILSAARACPVAAIIIKNEKGEKVFPE